MLQVVLSQLAGWYGSGLQSLPVVVLDVVPSPFQAILQAGGVRGELQVVTGVRQLGYMAGGVVVFTLRVVHADVSLTVEVWRAARDRMVASLHIQLGGVSTVRRCRGFSALRNSEGDYLKRIRLSPHLGRQKYRAYTTTLYVYTATIDKNVSTFIILSYAQLCCVAV